MDLKPLLTFQAVAEAASFTGAARRLGLDKSRVSRVVAGLEADLGAALFVRSTRAVRLTAEGERLLRDVAPHLAGLATALRGATDRTAPLVGEVAVTSTPDLGRALLGPALATFRVRYPGLTVRVVLEHALVDLAAAGVDLALRVGRPGPGSHVARKLGEVEAGFYAAPEYLARRGTPRVQADLAGHDGLWPVPPRGQRTFGDGGKDKAPPAPAIACADFGFLLSAARAGAGVALLPTFLVASDVAAGRLARVLPEVRRGGAPLYLVWRPERPVAPRVMALRTHLLEALTRSR
jgi:DNA-binding transcriptional LysR family regulator